MRPSPPCNQKREREMSVGWLSHCEIQRGRWALAAVVLSPRPAVAVPLAGMCSGQYFPVATLPVKIFFFIEVKFS